MRMANTRVAREEVEPSRTRNLVWTDISLEFETTVDFACRLQIMKNKHILKRKLQELSKGFVPMHRFDTYKAAVTKTSPNFVSASFQQSPFKLGKLELGLFSTPTLYWTSSSLYKGL